MGRKFFVGGNWKAVRATPALRVPPHPRRLLLPGQNRRLPAHVPPRQPRSPDRPAPSAAPPPQNGTVASVTALVETLNKGSIPGPAVVGAWRGPPVALLFSRTFTVAPAYFPPAPPRPPALRAAQTWWWRPPRRTCCLPRTSCAGARLSEGAQYRGASYLHKARGLVSASSPLCEIPPRLPQQKLTRPPSRPASPIRRCAARSPWPPRTAG